MPQTTDTEGKFWTESTQVQPGSLTSRFLEARVPANGPALAASPRASTSDGRNGLEGATTTNARAVPWDERNYGHNDSESEVEAVVDTESESGSELPSRQHSFAFSTLTGGSASTAMTSVMSSSTNSSPRKRNLEYNEVHTYSDWPSPSPKSRRIRLHPPSVHRSQSRNTPRATQSSTSTSTQYAEPGVSVINAPSTPSHSRRGTTSGNAPGSTGLTPSINRVSIVGRTPTNPSSRGRNPEPVYRSTIPTVSAITGNIVIIAHSRDVQQMMDERHIAWGTQYEVARGVSRGAWKWEHVTASKLDQLKGSNKDTAHRVTAVITGRNMMEALSDDDSLWAELDREQAAITEGKLRGMGLVEGEWHGVQNWYGGKIQQVARITVVEPKQDNPFSLRLERLEKKKSNRFARFLGSRRLLQVKIPKKSMLMLGPQIQKFLAQRFVICGRIFVPFCAKDSKVYMMEENENFQRKPCDICGDSARMPLTIFLDWHNPPETNRQQPVTKWITRFDLGLSTSVPVLRFEEIFYIDDLTADHDNGESPTEKIFTDGCGYMNGAALMMIGRVLKLSERPTAVQGRVAGAKGLWLLHPEDHLPDAPPRIWIRKSQVKIELPERLRNPEHRIFDLVAPPRVMAPSRLSKDTIINFVHNGVPAEIIVNLMKEGLSEVVRGLTQWTGPYAMPCLWDAVNKSGHIAGIKLQRKAAGIARAMGLAGRERDELYELDEPGDDDEDDEEDTEVDNSSAPPESFHETVLELIQAGFEPLESLYMFDKLYSILQSTIDGYIKKFHIVAPKSAEAFIAPDPYGILEEGEIHFVASQPLKDPLSEQYPNHILGPVLIYRNPTRLPSDVQKVNAVMRAELAEFKNIILLPIKGYVSLASKLAGGDVDGDTAVIHFDEAIVQSFVNPPLNLQSPDFADNFEREVDILHDCLSKIKNTFPESAHAERQQALQQHLLVGLRDSRMGLYSIFHDAAIYKLGYDHQTTLRIAHIFNILLDSRKNGRQVKDSVFKEDRNAFGDKRPRCMISEEKAEKQSDFLKRPPHMGPFILDILIKAGEQLKAKYLNEFQSQKRNIVSLDPDLLKPLREAESFKQLAPVISRELEAIRVHVDLCLKEWSRIWTSSDHRTQAKKNRKAVQKAAVHKLRERFKRGPDDAIDMIEGFGGKDKVMAAIAYTTDRNKKFVWEMAFKTLCLIKAEARGPAAFTREMAEMMSMPSAMVKVIAQARSSFVA